MKNNFITFNSIFTIVLFCSLVLLISSCATNEVENEKLETKEVSDDDVMIVLDEPEEMYSMQPPSVNPEDNNDFKVVLSVDSIMYLGQSGMMQVWIGDKNIDVTFSEGMTQDEKTLPSSIGQYAKITPYAPDFEVTALSTILCYKIDPSGSEIRYSLVPKDEGDYKVSADIELYETSDCTGIAVPKTARALSVSVGVNMNKEISKGIHKMESVVWDKFMVFWIALITLIFGAAIFVIRKYIKNKTGFEDSGNPS